MDFSSLSNSELVESAKRAVRKERECTLIVVNHLLEIDKRKAHVEIAFGELKRFAVEELGLSEGAAGRRIGAMALIKDVPEAAEMIASGVLSLTVAAMAQCFANKQKYSIARKRELLQELENASEGKAQRQFAKLAPGKMPRERVRRINENTSELRVPMPNETLAKLDRLKEVLSHLNLSYAELIDRIAEEGLEKHDPVRRHGRRSATPVPMPESVALTQAKKDAVHARDESCVWTCKETGRRCENKRYAQVDHFIEKALGGSNDLENLRLLCFEHNQLEARKRFGAKKMARYRKKSLREPTKEYSA